MIMSQFIESLQSTIPKSDLSIDNKHHLCASVDFSSSVWNTPGNHRLFNVSGFARIRLWAFCKKTLADSVCQMMFSVSGVSASGSEVISPYFNFFCDGEAYESGPTLKIGDVLTSNSAYRTKASYMEMNNNSISLVDNVVKDIALSDNIDLILHGSDTPLTDGAIDFHIIWDALEDGATVTLGDGALEVEQ
jgi:hypothetical protein